MCQGFEIEGIVNVDNTRNKKMEVVKYLFCILLQHATMEQNKACLIRHALFRVMTNDIFINCFSGKLTKRGIVFCLRNFIFRCCPSTYNSSGALNCVAGSLYTL